MAAPAEQQVRELAERLGDHPEPPDGPDWFALARVALAYAAEQQPTYADALALARGCHDYGGGYSGDKSKVYHHGIQTVVNVLEAAADGINNQQLRVVHAIGSAEQQEDDRPRCESCGKPTSARSADDVPPCYPCGRALEVEQQPAPPAPALSNEELTGRLWAWYDDAEGDAAQRWRSVAAKARELCARPVATPPPPVASCGGELSGWRQLAILRRARAEKAEAEAAQLLEERDQLAKVAEFLAARLTAAACRAEAAEQEKLRYVEVTARAEREVAELRDRIAGAIFRLGTQEGGGP